MAARVDRFKFINEFDRVHVVTFHDQPEKAARYRQSLIDDGLLILDELHRVDGRNIEPY